MTTLLEFRSRLQQMSCTVQDVFRVGTPINPITIDTHSEIVAYDITFKKLTEVVRVAEVGAFRCPGWIDSFMFIPLTRDLSWVEYKGIWYIGFAVHERHLKRI